MNGSLYELSTNVRKFALVVIVIVLGVIIFDTGIKFINSPANPFFVVNSPYLEADLLFGQIPVPDIPTLAIDDSSQPTFAVDGVIADKPDTVLVYKIEQPREKLDTIEDARLTASRLGFTTQFTEATGGALTWLTGSQSRSLNFNRNLQTWRLRTQYFVDAEAMRPKKVRDDAAFYEGRAKSVAGSLGLSPDSISAAKAVAKIAKLEINGLFTNPLTAASADYVLVNLYRQFEMAKFAPTSTTLSRQGKEEMKGFVYTNDPRVGSMRMVVTGEVADLTKEVYELDFTNYEFNYNYGVYRIVSPQEAWDRVRLGKGALTLLQPQGADYFAPSQVLKVSRFVLSGPEVELGYWEPPITDTNRYIYPVYIFRGRAELADNRPAGQFVFYVDALVRN